jgi:hypothetical protein
MDQIDVEYKENDMCLDVDNKLRDTIHEHLYGNHMCFIKSEAAELLISTLTDEAAELLISTLTDEEKMLILFSKAIREDAKNVNYIPDNLVLKLFELDCIGYDQLPTKFKTYDVSLVAVQKNGDLYLKHVPEEYKDYYMYLEAVKNSGFLLNVVPPKYMDYTMCLTAVTNRGCVLKDVPEIYKDHTMCLTAVKENGHSLKFIPKDLRTLILCEAAVAQTGLALKYVPDNLKSYKLCFDALCEHRRVIIIDYFPPSLVTEYAYWRLMELYGFDLQHVPLRFRAYGVCFNAVQQCANAFKYVPNEHKTFGLCSLAITKYYHNLERIHESNLTLEEKRKLYIMAVKINVGAIVYIPVEERSFDMCSIIFKNAYETNNNILTKYIPDNIREQLTVVVHM